MCAIAHFLEEEGIATTLVALIRLHAEKACPPRALWVPFQLGRPIGAPSQPEFQRNVMRAALSLLEREAAPPVLEDFPEDEPGAADVPGWRPPVALDAQSVAQEIEQLMPWYRRAIATTGRSTVGVTGLDIETVARFLVALDTSAPVANPRKDFAQVQLLRYAVDELKAFYLEAITAAGEPPSGWQMAWWFWEKTLAGRLVNELRENSFAHRDPQRRFATWWLVPDGFSSRTDVARMRQNDYRAIEQKKTAT